MNKSVKKHIKKAASFAAVGGIGLIVAGVLAGCDNKENIEKTTLPADSKEQGYFIVIQETGPDKYKIIEQYPTPGTTRAILKKADGTEELLNEEQLKELSAAEAKKVEDGTSRLTQVDDGSMGSGGMSLGETILASAAGAIIGSWLGNKLFNNANYQQRVNKTPTTMSPKSPASAKPAATPQRKSGFMKKTTSRRSFGFGG